MSNFPKHAERLLLRRRDEVQRERDYAYYFSIRDALVNIATGNVPNCNQTIIRVPTQESLSVNPAKVRFNCDPRDLGFIDLTPRLLAQTVLAEFREIEAEADEAIRLFKGARLELSGARKRISDLEMEIVKLREGR